MGNTKIATLKIIPGVGYTVDQIIDVPGEIKINIQDGDIGELGTRRITHSNTFNIELNDYNLNVLKLNVYNITSLAKTMNKKVRCRLIDDYYSKDGFLLVSNIDKAGKKIVCNFTDASLDIVDKWGAYSYAQYLMDGSFGELPQDYEDAILEMNNINMQGSVTVTPIGQGTEQAAIWPTNLNSIGEQFNIGFDGVRIPADNLNALQTRPAFNVKFFLEFMALFFGYAPVFSYSANVGRLSSSYIVNKAATEDIYITPPGGTVPGTPNVKYDQFGQYVGFVDLQAEAPNDITAKELLVEILNQQGLLCHIDSIKKEIYYYTYSDAYYLYTVFQDYQDWSDYLINKDRVKYDSNFGSQFGRSNIIGLKDPYPGNTYNYEFTEQGDLSKYESTKTNLSKKLKDVTNILSVNSAGSYPYFEYTHDDLTIVEATGTIAAGGLTQYYHNGLAFTTVPASLVYKLSNFNYGTIPGPLNYWYQLVEDGIKVSAEFLLPQKIIDEYEPDMPVVVNGLYGVFSINKIKEYVGGFVPVTVDLIKIL